MISYSILKQEVLERIYDACTKGKAAKA